jgi:hypothetical protein
MADRYRGQKSSKNPLTRNIGVKINGNNFPKKYFTMKLLQTSDFLAYMVFKSIFDILSSLSMSFASTTLIAARIKANDQN